MARSTFPLIALLLVSGCAADLQMRPAAMAARPSESDAVVVFIRRGRELPTNALELHDHDGRWLGRLGAETRTSVRVTPGQHFFVAQVLDRYNTRPTALFAELEAGRTYYVEATIFAGFVALFGVSQRVGERGDVERWLRDTTELEPVPGAAPPVDPAEWDRLLAYLMPWFTGLPVRVAAERSLLVEDGVAATLASEPGEPLHTRPLSAMAAEAENATPVAVLADAEVPKCIRESPVGSHLRTLKCFSDQQLFVHQLAVQEVFRKAKLTR